MSALNDAFKEDEAQIGIEVNVDGVDTPTQRHHFVPEW